MSTTLENEPELTEQDFVALSIRPLPGRVLIKHEEVTETKGGIVLPESSESMKLATRGVVVSRGEPLPDGPSREDFDVGSIVYFEIFGKTDVEIKGKDYVVVKEDAILLQELKTVVD